MMNRKAHIKTYGCQMNEQDSLHMKGLLSQIGYQPHSDYDADIVLLVTCSIREKAVQKVYSELGRIRPYVENNPNMIVGIAGCVAQQEKENLFKRFPFLNLVFGPDAIRELPEMVREAEKGKSVLKTKFDLRQDFEFINLTTDNEESQVKAFVNIQKGCDNVCSFCIVPRVRGAEVSRPSQQIIDEVKSLIDLGVKEITLLGQNVNSYGLKHSNEISFAKLLEKVAATGIERLRFTTSHPKDVKDDLIGMYESLPNLMPHFHLPVQSGSNKILENMRRQYTREDYLSIVEKLKKARPEITFTSDIIVGFPGETSDDFEKTLLLVDEVQFDQTFSFVYSPRPHTTAIKLEDNVSKEEKSNRLQVLQTRQRQIAIKKNEALEDSIQEILVESFDAISQKYLGRTQTNKIVHALRPENMPIKDLTGETIQVKIHKGNPNSLMGEILWKH